MDSQILNEVISTRMPFGKYKGTFVCDIPEYYLVWYHSKGFPEGKIGMLLATMYEIKINGLEYLLKPLKQNSNE